ncbi:MAG TPA: bifunctional adenosylcobinamide kinase/adenosylcobinamide-phosphate guanylyltransferase [Stellaceae bacterium]|nr:bifunctional adenosylcobinamide kinase/adenosylcobinamide-phosphate guanylyltransferase [Stellaceae bacterium]
MPDRVEASRRPVSAVLLPPLTLVLGGARSGKSRYAEALIEAAAPAALYFATAQALDDEMSERIRHHRARRGQRWTTREAPLDLAAALSDGARPERPVLVDCLTLWLSNLLMAGRDVEAAIAELIETLPRLEGPAVLVANEVGLGIVPDNALARAFRDHAGRLNQRVAAAADCVVLVAAGLPLVLKEARKIIEAPTSPSRCAGPSLSAPGGGEGRGEVGRSADRQD